MRAVLAALFQPARSTLSSQIWGVWWTIATFYEHLSAQAGGKGFRSRPWHPVFFGSARVRRLPLEPIFKIVLPAIGILGELWLGHESYMCVAGSRAA